MANVVKLFQEASVEKEKVQRFKLTKRFVDAIRPAPDRDVVFWDSELPGFCVRVKPTSVRSYAIQYRNRDGKSCRMTLGRHGVLTTEQARNEARQKLAEAKLGSDPLTDRNEARKKAKTATIQQLADRYLRDYAEVRKKPSSVKEDRRLIEKRINQQLGDKHVDALTRDHVLDLHHLLRKTPYEANRCLALLSKMLNLAEVWGLRPQGSNPCRYVERYTEKARDRFLSDEEMGRLGTVIEQLEHSRTQRSGVIVAIKLLALTGCRLSEVLNLEWIQVDLDAGVLRLGDAKAGGRLVPLGTAAVELLSDLPHTGKYVVRGMNPGQPLSMFTVEDGWRTIRDKAKLVNARLHDLRHTVGSIAGQHGWNAFTVKALLGHKTLAMTDRYVTHDVSPLQKAASDVSERIAAAMNRRDKEAKND